MDQATLLRNVIEILETQKIAYILVGDFASDVYGEPRLSQGIDLMVALRPDQADPLSNAFPSEHFCLSVDAARQAVQHHRL